VLKQDSTRSPSPEVVVSVSTPFKDLPIRQQLVHLKPVLYAIMNGRYAPALADHSDFMKGGQSRRALNTVDRVVKMGTLDGSTTKHLTRWLYHLVLSNAASEHPTNPLDHMVLSLLPLLSPGAVADAHVRLVANPRFRRYDRVVQPMPSAILWVLIGRLIHLS
jgi:hypothetical protein